MCVCVCRDRDIDIDLPYRIVSYRIVSYRTVRNMRSRWKTPEQDETILPTVNTKKKRSILSPPARQRTRTRTRRHIPIISTVLSIMMFLTPRILVVVGGFVVVVVVVMGMNHPPPPYNDASHTSTSSTHRLPHNEHPYCFDYGCVRTPPDYDETIQYETQYNYNDTTRHPSHNHNNILMMTRQSNRHNPPHNQDAAIYISPFYATTTTTTTQESLPTQDDIPPPSQLYCYDFLMGIFDGHGKEGHIVAQYMAKEFPRILSQKLGTTIPHPQDNDDHHNIPPKKKEEEEAWISQLLKESFVEVDRAAPPNAMVGGCTASVTLRYQNTLYFANAGDSRTILVSSTHDHHQPRHPPPPLSPMVNITYMTRLDKAHLPDEQSRIEELGGTIHIPPQNPQGSRVIVYSTADKATHGEQIGLAMSRSIGDWEWKAVGVIAEPLVDVIHLPPPSSSSWVLSPVEEDKDEDHNNTTTLESSSSSVQHEQLFILAASDGLWDTRPRPLFWAKQVSDYFGKSRSNSSTGTTTTLAAAAASRKIIDQASSPNPKFYRDDITFMAIQV